MGDIIQEKILMTPKKKTANSTTLVIERRAIKETSNKMHVAGGDHQGIIINKELASDAANAAPAQVGLEFRVFLVNANTGKHTQESRQLQFWFREGFPEKDQSTEAQNFFRELVSPKEFPRDYVGFIKKVMKLMQHQYPDIRMIEVELKQLEETELPQSRPVSVDESILDSRVELTEEKVLEMIESSYPNPITVEDLARDRLWNPEEVLSVLQNLQEKGLVKAMDNGAYTRVVQDDTDVVVVKQMPTIVSSKQPSIAIITAQYCEKLAVDAMIENKETFVRYTTVGESNVYTLGNIGAHRVVCTKLPSVGHTREAMIAAGNTTTRLLGTFQKVDYVFLVGVGGGVPHYTDYHKHVRLGDVVISSPALGQKYVYVYCENADQTDAGLQFEIKSWHPPSLALQDIASQLRNQSEAVPSEAPWLKYLSESMQRMQNDSEPDFSHPPVESDKLYMAIGERDIIEVAHPQPMDGNVDGSSRLPRVHLGAVGSGRQVARTEQLRQSFSSQFGVLAFDSEFDAVVESILGNCRDNFIFIRGIADYKDGTRKRDWQPYASLVASSVMKAIVCGMDPPTDD